METAASIIAFFTLTLATVKSCRDLLSAVKDGPEKLNHVTAAISALVSVFEKIETEPQFEIVLSSTSLRKVTKKCQDDFEMFNARLEKVKILPDERRCGKIWKRLKLAFSEKDLSCFLAVVEGHVGKVSLELNMIQLQSLNRIEGNTGRILALQETFSLAVEEQSTTLQAVHDHASDAAKHGVDLREAIESLTQKMMAMPSASHEQTNTMLEKLSKIEEEITKTKTVPANKFIGSLFNEPFMHPTAFDPDPGADEHSALDRSMSRLSDLVTNVECTMESGDAKGIIDDLDMLLRTAATWNRDIKSTSHWHAARQSKPGLDINELRGQFLKAKKVQLNKALARTTVPGFRVTRQQRSYAKYKGSDGILRIQRHYRILDRGSPRRATLSDETIIATWMPDNLEVPISITISYHEKVEAGMSSTLPPSLVVSPVLRPDHPVFETIRYGKVDDLMRLLSEKKAWLRARDPYGASLLHYATRNFSVMQFLIAKGADVDDLAESCGAGGIKGYLQSPLQLSVLAKDDNSACFKQLLAAGANPFLPSGDILPGHDWGTAIGDAALRTDYIYMKAAADEIADTCDAHGLFAAGAALLHNSTWNCHLGSMRILIEQGVDINAGDSHGNNCLYTLLLSSESRPSYPRGIGAGFLETARYLIENGIDMAPTASGVTPGRFAYHLALNPECSSWIGDIWDRTLAACGMDVAESRVGHLRVGQYNDDYTLDTFKAIWDGHEGLCPYYEEAITNCGTYASPVIDWSQVSADEDCPYCEWTEGSDHDGPDDSLSNSSEDSSHEGGVALEPMVLDTSEDD